MDEQLHHQQSCSSLEFQPDSENNIEDKEKSLGATCRYHLDELSNQRSRQATDLQEINIVKKALNI